MYSRFRRGYNRRLGKYTSENYNCLLAFAPGEDAKYSVVVGDTSTAGVRKVKNFTIYVPNIASGGAVWALVYVPQGLDQNAGLNIATSGNAVSLYEPNQNVIACGCLMNHGQIVRSRLARNLGSGDSIVLVMKLAEALTGAEPLKWLFSVSYAIKFG